jgi:hypothetical protein
LRVFRSEEKTETARTDKAETVSVAATATAEEEEESSRVVVALPGGGIYFYWNAGVLSRLNERYDLRQCELQGASAGGLAIALLACDIDIRHATEAAYRLATENNLYERPLALVGVWGRLLREWLEELLPEDAHERCESWIKVSVLEVNFPPLESTTFPSDPFVRKAYSHFESKQDLIECLMASAHIPLLLNYKPFTTFRGRLCIDGSALKNNVFDSEENLLRQRKESESLRQKEAVVFPDKYSDKIIAETMDLPSEKPCDIYLTYMKDECIQDDFFDFLQLKSFDGVMSLVDAGYQYAEREEERGGFQALEPFKM